MSCSLLPILSPKQRVSVVSVSLTYASCKDGEKKHNEMESDGCRAGRSDLCQMLIFRVE